MAECMTPEHQAHLIHPEHDQTKMALIRKFEMEEKFKAIVAKAYHEAIAAAVAEEREACAKVVEAQPILGIFSSDYTGKIAAAIRARSEGDG